MAFTSGTATDHYDLIKKLRTYLIAQGWTELAWTDGGSVTAQSTLKIRGPGAGAGKEVFFNVRTFADAANNIYSWEMRVACAYSAAAPWGTQLGENPNNCYFNLSNLSLNYWFYVNDRRVIVVAKTGTNYVSMHAGFVLPFGTPAQYPFPLYLCGDYNIPTQFSLNNASRRHCFDPGNRSDTQPNAWARSADNVWYPIANHINSSNTNWAAGSAKGQRGWVWPFHAGGATNGNIGSNNPWSWNGGGLTGDHAWDGEFMQPTQQGERMLMPIMVCGGDIGPFGVMDGAYAVGGAGLATEGTITIGARTFRVFQNVQRNSPDDFYCIEEI